jgi:hypothetical protein
VIAVVSRARLDRMMTESQWQEQVVTYARLRGWKVVHFRPARTSRGWRTPPVQYDASGFPDLVLVKPGDRILYVELKSERGQLTKEQARWLAALDSTHAQTFCWRPSDWPTVQAVLSP